MESRLAVFVGICPASQFQPVTLNKVWPRLWLLWNNISIDFCILNCRFAKYWYLELGAGHVYLSLLTGTFLKKDLFPEPVSFLCSIGKTIECQSVVSCTCRNSLICTRGAWNLCGFLFPMAASCVSAPIAPANPPSIRRCYSCSFGRGEELGATRRVEAPLSIRDAKLG